MTLKYSTQEDEVDKTNSVEELKKIAKTYKRRAKHLKWQRRALIWLLGLILAVTAYFGSVWFLSNVLADYFIHEVPVLHVKRAEAKELKWPDIGDCEQYRPVVQKYFGALTNEALFVASKESGCVADRISEKNSNGTRDFCLFQINQEKLTAQSLDVCVRRAFEKYTAGRVGVKNWSAWYAVCDVNTKPIYPNIKNCS